MFAALKAEFRKLFTVRTTYGIAGFALVIVIAYTFYVEGLRAGDTVHMASKLASETPGAIQAVSLLAGLVALFLMTHEYRYNTIMYTLTSARRRTMVLVAKIVAISAFALLFAAVVGLLAPAMTYLGLHIKGLSLVPQHWQLWDIAWQAAFYTWAYAMFGLLFATLLRSQVASIVALFMVPSTVQLILALLLKKNAIYLPFNALDQVLQAGTKGPGPNGLAAGHAAVIVCAYLVVGWVVAWILFLRRDAN